MKVNKKLYKKRQFQDHMRHKCQQLNSLENNFEGRYDFFSVRIPIQPNHIKQLDFEGVQSSMWIRTTFRNRKLKSLTNYISPWDKHNIKHMWRQKRLQQLQTRVERKLKKRKFTKNVVFPKNKSYKHVKKRFYNWNKRTQWINEYSNFIFMRTTLQQTYSFFVKFHTKRLKNTKNLDRKTAYFLLGNKPNRIFEQNVFL